MTLENYLQQPGAMNLTALSAAVGVSKARLSQIKSSGKWPPHLALKVEAVTDGQIDASTISGVVAEARASA